jgi:hypothetical protein
MPKLTKPTDEQYRAFQAMFLYFNHQLFKDSLPSVFLNFSRKNGAFGFFAPDRWSRADASSVTHEISINPAHLRERDPRDTAATLVHEMCHLWQHVHGDPPRRGYHDTEWSTKMLEVGLIPWDAERDEHRMSAHALTHQVAEDGPFLLAYRRMPDEYLLPWRCLEEGERPSGGRGRGGGGAGGEAEGEGEGGGEGPAPKSRNKVKYSCPGCATNVWGKPDLEITCTPCGQAFAVAV